MVLSQDVFVQFRVVKGNNYLVNKNNVFQIDEIGLEIWNQFNGKNSLEEICAMIAVKYNVDNSIIERDLHSFVNELLELNLLEVCN